jgi:hypothetical protein
MVNKGFKSFDPDIDGDPSARQRADGLLAFHEDGIYFHENN